VLKKAVFSTFFLPNLTPILIKLNTTTMNLLLAVLLYLNVITSPGTYNLSYINTEGNTLQTQVQQTEADTAKMTIINTVYLPRVNDIVIIDDNIGG
jgi:hypothetical protein